MIHLSFLVSCSLRSERSGCSAARGPLALTAVMAEVLITPYPKHPITPAAHGLSRHEPCAELRPRSYLALLGQLTKEKGPETAIGLVKAAGLPSRMTAKIPRSETRYYKERLLPIIDHDQIRLVGEMNDAGKGDLLRGAAALLFPIDWPDFWPGHARGHGLRDARDRPSARFQAELRRQAETPGRAHIEEGYESRGVPEKETERRARATVNKQDHGGKSGSGSATEGHIFVPHGPASQWLRRGKPASC